MAFRTVSQTGIRYPKSFLSKSLNGLPDTAPQAGDRFPWLRLKFTAGGPVEDLFQKLSDMYFHLILLGQPPLPENARISAICCASTPFPLIPPTTPN